MNIDIIDNRTKFIKEYGIKYSTLVPRYIKSFLGISNVNTWVVPRNIYEIDHMEAYRDKDTNIVIVYSPYVNRKDYDPKKIPEGWKILYSLYDANSITLLYKYDIHQHSSIISKNMFLVCERELILNDIIVKFINECLDKAEYEIIRQNLISENALMIDSMYEVLKRWRHVKLDRSPMPSKYEMKVCLKKKLQEGDSPNNASC